MARAAAPKLKIKTANIGGRNIDPRDIGKVMGGQVTASINKGVSKLRTPMRDMLYRVYGDLEKKHGRQWTPSGLFGPRPSMGLKRRTGRGLQSIRDSIKVRYVGDGKGVTGEITAGTMGIHEKGGVVRPSSRRYLAIPTVYALSSTGTPLRASATDWDRTFVRRTESGNRFIFQRGKGTIRPLYLLKKKVKIPPRLKLRETLEKHAAAFDRKAIAAIRKEM